MCLKGPCCQDASIHCGLSGRALSAAFKAKGICIYIYNSDFYRILVETRYRARTEPQILQEAPFPGGGPGGPAAMSGTERLMAIALGTEGPLIFSFFFFWGGLLQGLL